MDKIRELEGVGKGLTLFDWSSRDQFFREIKWGGGAGSIYLS